LQVALANEGERKHFAMKRQIVQLLAMALLVISVASCSSSRNTGRYTDSRSSKSQRMPGILYPDARSSSNKGLPPGQAKKITGAKSAKAYAPGQQKKYSNGNGNGKGHGKKGKKH
jgi:uncharacterized lipoprotein